MMISKVLTRLVLYLRIFPTSSAVYIAQGCPLSKQCLEKKNGICVENCEPGIDPAGNNIFCNPKLCPEKKECSCRYEGPGIDDHTKTCFVHPDPHFRNWHGNYFDFQDGCDVILVTSQEIEFHLRLAKKAQHISGAESLAIRIDNSNAISTGGDILEITEDGNYYFNDPNRSTANPGITTVAGYTFTHSGTQFEIFLLPAGHYIKVQATSSYGLSITIRGHRNMFTHADGMCGDWDLSGLRNRNDALVNGQQLGDDWQVGIGPSDAVILSNVAIVNPNGLSGHATHPASCHARRRLTKQQLDGGKSCNFCDMMVTAQQTSNCKYDAALLGCNWVQGSKEAPFYSKVYNEEFTDFYHPDIIKSDTCLRSEKCIDMKGVCVKECIPDPVAGIVCDFNMCDGDACICLYKNCEFPLVNSVYCPLHDVSVLVAATHAEAKTFGSLVNPDGVSTIDSLTAGYNYLYNGKNNIYNLFKTYPSYSTTKSETLMCYKEYYGPDYEPNTVVKAALKREKIDFLDGPALSQDFSETVRTNQYYINEESAKKINQYTTALLQMYQLMEEAVQKVAQDRCISYVHKESGAEACQEAVDIWDNAAAVQDGPNYLGTKRCQNYLTCGWNYTNSVGEIANIAIANQKVLNLFQVGQSAIRTGDVVGAKGIIKLIQSAQLVAYIQGVGRYAYTISASETPNVEGENKEYAEGGAFATGMLPQLYKCNRAAAKTVDKTFQLKAGNSFAGTIADFLAVLRSEYQCLGITCEDVGGLWDGESYYAGAGPCVTNYGDYLAV